MAAKAIRLKVNGDYIMYGSGWHHLNPKIKVKWSRCHVHPDVMQQGVYNITYEVFSPLPKNDESECNQILALTPSSQEIEGIEQHVKWHQE